MNSAYHRLCVKCLGLTTHKHAREHDGLCRYCARVDKDGIPIPRLVRNHSKDNDKPSRESRILEHGYRAYATEEGHYDPPGEDNQD